MVTRRLALLGLALAATSAVAFFLPPTVQAQARGDFVTFIVPAGTGPVPGADVVIFIGRSVGTIDASNCVVDGVPRPVQSAVVIAPGSGNRATRFNNEVIPLSSGVTFPLSAQTSPVPNGALVWVFSNKGLHVSLAAITTIRIWAPSSNVPSASVRRFVTSIYERRGHLGARCV